MSVGDGEKYNKTLTLKKEDTGNKTITLRANLMMQNPSFKARIIKNEAFNHLSAMATPYIDYYPFFEPEPKPRSALKKDITTLVKNVSDYCDATKAIYNSGNKDDLLKFVPGFYPDLHICKNCASKEYWIWPAYKPVDFRACHVYGSNRNGFNLLKDYAQHELGVKFCNKDFNSFDEIIKFIRSKFPDFNVIPENIKLDELPHNIDFIERLIKVKGFLEQKVLDSYKEVGISPIDVVRKKF